MLVSLRHNLSSQGSSQRDFVLVVSLLRFPPSHPFLFIQNFANNIQLFHFISCSMRPPLLCVEFSLLFILLPNFLHNNKVLFIVLIFDIYIYFSYKYIYLFIYLFFVICFGSFSYFQHSPQQTSLHTYYTAPQSTSVLVMFCSYASAFVPTQHGSSPPERRGTWTFFHIPSQRSHLPCSNN
jgi:hypothetical protein